MSKSEELKSGLEVSATAGEFELPTHVYIEIGSGSKASFADESHGINSGAHNKSTDELRDVFEGQREAILQAATSDIRHLFQSTPG